MPLRLNVGVSKEVGLPEYSCVGASVNLEVELDSGALQDLDGFHVQVRDVLVAARQALNDELARLRGQPASPIATAAPSANGNGHRDGSGAPTNGPAERSSATRGRSTRPAAPGQAKAVYAIARSQRADPEGLLRDEYGVDRPEDLSLSQASAFIDQLKAAAGI